MRNQKVVKAIEDGNPSNNISDAVTLLRRCQPLVTRLLGQGVTITLNRQEKASLLGFQEVEQRGYNDRDWSYLRMASGVQISGIAALNSCLLHYHQARTSLS